MAASLLGDSDLARHGALDLLHFSRIDPRARISGGEEDLAGEPLIS